ncbi:transposase [Microbispora sp. H13382]|uniref:transposase n=1 Tax=Microbispora sp. H13382 TaxID=2729112 RepID=UPI001601261B|nr:transposase [Microbispora sp. H13382]
MPAPRKYPQELRERAVRMVFEVRRQTGGAPGAIARVADQLGVHREALRGWVRQADLNALAARLNNRPRKCLGYRTPAQCVP